MDRVPLPGLEPMRSWATQLPSHLRAGFRAGTEVGLRKAGSDRVHVAAVGGSAIGADLVKGLTDAETDLCLTVSRSPEVPRYAGQAAWTILVSYSGQTWETLQAYENARRLGGPVAVVSSGGELTERALRDQVPHLALPGGLPPRAAVGYLFGGLLGLLDPYFPESNERRLERTASAIEDRIPRWADPRGAPSVCARELGERSALVVADVAFAGLARRWTTQFEENAKVAAGFDLLPEFFHNGIEAWAALRRDEARDRAVLTLEWGESAPEIRWSFDYLERVLRARGVPVGRMKLGPSDRLEATVEGIAMGDQVSLFLAERRGSDPLPIPAIAALKSARAKQPARTERVVPRVAARTPARPRRR